MVAITSGCVSAVIAQSGKEELFYPRDREQIVSTYGAPISSGRAKSGTNTKGTATWEVFQYDGLMRDDDFANGAATAGAVTLGVSEVVSLPSVILNRAGSAATKHLFLAEYRPNGEVHRFRRITKEELVKFKRDD